MGEGENGDIRRSNMIYRVSQKNATDLKNSNTS